MTWDEASHVEDDFSVRLIIPGYRTKKLAKILLVTVLILLTVFGSIGNWLPGIANALGGMFTPAANDKTSTNCPSATGNSVNQENGTLDQCSTAGGSQAIPPTLVGADPVSDLSLPKTTLSALDSLIGAGGVIQNSPQDLILYNLDVKERLLGGPRPHDELLGPSGQVLSSWSSWSVEAKSGDTWIPLAPTSSNFTIIGTNRTGTVVVRTMQVGSRPYSGVLRTIYKALSSGRFSWDLKFTPNGAGHFRTAYTLLNATQKFGLAASTGQFTAQFGLTNYTFAWDDVPQPFNTNATSALGRFNLSVDLGTVAANSPVDIDPYVVSTNVPWSATESPFQRKIFFDQKGGYYFAFYYDGVGVGYSSSHNGTIWSPRQSMAPNWPAYTDSASSYPSIYVSGQNIIAAAGNSSSTSYSCGVSSCSGSPVTTASLYYSQGNISGAQIHWQNTVTVDKLPIGCMDPYQFVIPNPCSASVAVDYVNVGVDASGRVAFSYNGVLKGSGDWGFCSSGSIHESDVFAIYGGQRFFADCETDSTVQGRSVILPYPGGARVIYQSHLNGRTQLMTRLFHGSGVNLPFVTTSGDTYIDYQNPNTNYGSASYLGVCQSNDCLDQMSFIHFLLPGIPYNGQYSKSTLSLTLNQGVDDNSALILFSAATSNWTESGLTWNTAVSTNNLPNLAQSVRSSLGCGQSPGCSGVLFGFTFDVSLAVWKLYLCNCNYGIVISLQDTLSTAYSFTSRELGPVPKLSVSYNCCMENQTTIDPNIANTEQFSALSDSHLGIHMVYPGVSFTNITYAYLSPTSTTWTHSFNILPGNTTNPVLTLDYTTGDVYAMGIENSGIVMRRKTMAGNWTDQSVLFAITKRVNPTDLGSNMVSASASDSSRILLLWTEGIGPCNVTFASVPIQTVWSPFAGPADPWDGSGIAPYGEYFANLGEYVSPSTGMLTVKQTDLSLAGRGLTLDLTRVYTEPYSFLTNQTYNYDNYPWAPLGDGWQLNFPWLYNTTHPAFVHLWNGEGYRIPSNFWTGSSSNFENHQGENFWMARYGNGLILLRDKTGVSYVFGTRPIYPNHALVSITDPTGNNTIFFSYNANNQISCISDTLQRAFAFSYSGGMLQQISQVNGSCSNQGSQVRRVFYTYANDGQNGKNLILVSDPANRNTTYTYGTPAWLLTRITYPTHWYDNYNYTAYTLGTTATSYRVRAQQVNATQASAIREFAYSYNMDAGDQVVNATVTSYNGTRVTAYTKYAFSFLAYVRNITDPSTGNLLSGLEQFFGVNGEVSREVVLVSDGQGHIGSYTNFYRYDLWGNQIYSRRVINPSSSWYHETFNAYYNDRFPLGFYAFQETFSQNNYTKPDNLWSVYNGTSIWNVLNGAYNGTSPVFRPANQEFFAWTNFTSPSISIIASIYITKNMTSSDQRAGLIAHYPGHGTREWALVLHNSTNGARLSLLDDNVAWVAESPCTITARSWYRFNFTISGSQAWGSATASGISCSVSGSFNSTDIATATGFGLDAGGYSTLFANVTATTTAPAISGATFSNAFIQKGAPNPNIHGALAGAAQLQNGTRSAPVESYLSYYSWGGLNQTRELLSSPTGPQWLTTSRTYDSYGNVKSLTDARGNITQYGYSSSYPGYPNSQSAYLTSLNQTLVPGGMLVSQRYSYNFTMGEMLSSVDPRGYNTTYKYDILGRPTRVTYPTGDYKTYSYNDLLNYVNVTNENGLLTRQLYDGLSRLSSTQRFLNGVLYSRSNSTYNWMDKVTSMMDPLGNAVTYQYDPLGRVIETIEPNRNVTQTFYNDTASWVRYQDESGNYRCSVFDRLGRLIQVIEFADSNCNSIQLAGYYYSTIYAHDEIGNLLRVSRVNYNFFLNPGFDTGNFNGWTVWTGMGIYVGGGVSGGNAAVDIQHGGGCAPLAFNLTQILSTPVSGSVITAFQFWYRGGFQMQMTVQILYSDGTRGQTSVSYSGGWTLEKLSPDKSKQVAGIIVSSPGSSTCVTNWYLDDFVLSTAQTTSYAYDSLNRLIQTTYLDGTSESYTYDSNNNLIRKIDRKGVVATSSYDSLNRLTNTAYAGAASITQSFSYDKNGNLVQLVGQNATIGYTFDARNRMLAETYLVNTGFNLTASPNPITIASGTAASSVTTLTSINGFSGTVSLSASSPAGISVSFTPTSVSLASGGTAASTATIAVSSSTPAGNYTVTITGTTALVTRSITLSVRVVGPFSLSVNPNWLDWVCSSHGCTPSFQTANINATTTAPYSSNTTLGLAYGCTSSPGNYCPPTWQTQPTTITIPAHQTSALTALWVKPLSCIIQNCYTYVKINATLNGQLVAQTTLTLHSCYVNCQLSPIRKTMPSGGVIPTFAPMGSPSGPSSSVSTSYTVSYAYNGEFLSNITYPDGLIVKYTYDGLGRIATVTKPGSTTNYASVTYNQNDQPSAITLGNGLTETYAYDKLSRPIQITVKNATATLLILSYNYNKTGTVSTVTGNITSARVSEQYSYDPLHRLINSFVQTGSTRTTLSYAYDNLGNRLSQTLNGNVTNYSYNATNNELTSSSTSGASTSYTYDGNGNLATKTLTSSTSYSWDQINRLVRVSAGGLALGAYSYDGLGRRVQSVETTETLYAYFGTETLSELFSSGTINDYLYADGMRVGRVSGSTVVYYHADVLGSTRLESSSSGTVLFMDSYQPYGQENGTPTGTDTYKFTGKPVSQTTGLYYYGARWYDPSIGRFISQDPSKGHRADPPSLNPYLYVENSPTNSIDPTGMADCGLNPLSWGGCAENAGGAAWNGLATAGADIENSWNNLTPEQQAWLYTAAVDAAAVGAVALTVATLGAATPLAVVAIGAAVGASTSTTIYTASEGDKATFAGAVGASVTGAISGAVGGGAGAAAGAIGGLSGTLAGMGIAGLGSVGSDVAGKYLTSSLGGTPFEVSGRELAGQFFVSALTFGIGSKLGSAGQNYVAGNIIAKNLGDPAITAYAAGASYNVEANVANAFIGVGTELLSEYLTRLLPN